MDADLAALGTAVDSSAGGADPYLSMAIIQMSAVREPLMLTHSPATALSPKQEVALEIAVARKLTSARLWYRHVNQAERWVSVEMAAANGVYRAGIPADYTDSPYPLQYYFEFRNAPDQAWLYPGFNADLLNQPYFVLHRS